MTKRTRIEKAIDNARLETDEYAPLPEGDEPSAPGPSGPQTIPTPVSPEWNDYVLGHFVEGELDFEGHPSTDACRRVVELLLGPIVEVHPEMVQTPDAGNGHRATAIVRVAIAWNNNPADVRTFGDGADVYPGNTDPAYARFAVATAITRAEGRAYRKALKLRKSVTSEEKTTVPVTECGLDRFITDGQLRAIEKTCRDMNVNVLAFLRECGIKDGKSKTVRYEKATELLEAASRLLQQPKKITDDIRGYDAAWRDQ